MTREEITALSAQVWSAGGTYIGPSIAQLSEFAALVAAKEREARQQAQREAEALRERIVKSGLELHRAVRDAAKDEREACAQVCDLEAAKWPYPSHGNAAVTMAATAIRARREAK